MPGLVLWNTPTEVVIRLTSAALDLFDQHSIFCDHQINDGPRRWKVGDVLRFQPDLEVEPYVGFLAGNDLCPIGAFSYSHSGLPATASLGRYCSISWNVRPSSWQHPVAAVTTSLATCNPHVRFVRAAYRELGIDKLKTVPTPQRPYPKLGNDVWVGQDVLLMSGITIGDGAIVAAGSVVTKDVPPYAIVGGAPAKLIRWRHPPEIIAALQELAWWRYNLADLQDLDFADPARFVAQLAVRAASLEPWTPTKLHLWDAVRQID